MMEHGVDRMAKLLSDALVLKWMMAAMISLQVVTLGTLGMIMARF